APPGCERLRWNWNCAARLRLRAGKPQGWLPICWADAAPTPAIRLLSPSIAGNHVTSATAATNIGYFMIILLSVRPGAGKIGGWTRHAPTNALRVLTESPPEP